MSAWHLTYRGYDPEEEGLREALCTVGNGVFATRGAAPECRAGGAHYPGTYRIGLYDRQETTIHGRTVTNEDLVNLPNWLDLGFAVADGEWFSPDAADLVDYELRFDIREAVLTRSLRFREAGRITRVTQRRFVSMADPHVAALETTFTAENWSGALRVRSGLDGRVRNEGVERYRELESRHLECVERGEMDAESLFLVARTLQSRVRIAEAARLRVHRPGEKEEAVERRFVDDGGYVAHRLDVDLREGEPVTLEKVVTLYTSLDHAISEAGEAAREHLRHACGFEELLARHVQAWSQNWRRSEIRIGHEEHSDRAVNLYLCHLLQTISPHTADYDVGVPARGIHGEAYRGHVFWDELFVFPVLDYRFPELTRSLLRYRYRRLEAARRAAREEGFEGAMFPWQSGSNGREESQTLHLNPRSGRWVPDDTHLQRHTNVAIPYNVWQHYQTTDDIGFMAFYGAELILEAARFWASLAEFDRDAGRYRIRGIVGPDEFHTRYPGADTAGLADNAYTNVMAVWVLMRALEVRKVIPARRCNLLTERLGLRPRELARWRRITRRMAVPFHDGVISQFAGYEALDELDWEGYRERYGDIHRLDRILEAEDDDINRYKASKQADVLMLFYLLSAEQIGAILGRLGYAYEPAMIPRTIDYYLERTSHGSTLSGVVHAWVLARANRERSWEFFRHALESDISDIQGGTTPEGIHLGAMAGTVDLLQRCYSGLEARGGVLRFEPYLPADLPELHFNMQYRGNWLEVDLTRERLALRAEASLAAPVEVDVRGDRRTLEPGEREVFDLRRERLASGAAS